MSDPSTLQGGWGTVVRAFGCAGVLATLVVPSGAPAQSAPAKREAGGRPAAGAAVISYEESRGGAIVYLEEGGGLVSQAGVPMPAPRREPQAPASRPAASAQAARPTPTPAPTAAGSASSPRVVTRQVANADGAAGRR